MHASNGCTVHAQNSSHKKVLGQLVEQKNMSTSAGIAKLHPIAHHQRPEKNILDSMKLTHVESMRNLSEKHGIELDFVRERQYKARKSEISELGE